MIDDDTKARWVAALRSGEYRQGKSLLRDSEDRFCCLGVLADLVDPHAWRMGQRWMWGTSGDVFLPADVLALYSQGVLSRWNDGGQTFSEIAELIERDPELTEASAEGRE